jgi:hypothetical protein
VRRKAIIALVFIVAGAVLVESWHAAANAAATGGRPWPKLWPVTLEAFIAVLVLVYWDARAEGRRAPHARTLLLATTAVASTIQALDAPRTWLGVLTAAWTPVSLLLTVEFATWLLYGQKAIRAAGTVREAAPAAPVRVPEVPPPTPPAPAAPAPKPAPRTAQSGSRARVAELVDADPHITISRTVGETGLSRTQAATLLREEKRRRNGHEVRAQ